MEEPRLIQSIKEQGGRVEKVAEFNGSDALIYQVYAVVDQRGRPKILMLKVTPNGFVKKAVQIMPADVEKLSEAILRAYDKVKQML